MADKDVINLDEANSNIPKKNKFKGIFVKIPAFLNKVKPKFSSIFGGAFSKARKIFHIFFSKLPILKEKLRNKKILYFALAVIGILFIAWIIFLLTNKDESLEEIYKPKEVTITSQSNITNVTKIKPIQKQELQDLITKAAILYNSGQILGALDIYTNISIFSSSIANFNLGVAKLNTNYYKDSIIAFNDTINSGENVAAAAINAAVAAYKLNDIKMYDYYINLASGTMIDWYNSPLYSYLYSLVNYYSMNYFNMLSSLKNTTSNYYEKENANLLSKIYLNFNDDYNALKTLLDVQDVNNSFTIGLLQARMGEYDLAYDRIDNYLRNTTLDNPQAQMALALIELKRSNFIQSANIYDSLMQKYDMKDLNKIYPIKIKLQDSLFDVNIIQKNFWNRSTTQNLMFSYKILFYFAPFRVFDVEETISSIRDGGLKLKMNNIEEANNTLLSSVMLSRINSNITQGLKEILNYDINGALRIMKQASLSYPNHQVLQYNLGLIYAQLNDFDNARKHFLKAYHLDENDILSGIFALMCSDLTNIDRGRILNDITSSFEYINFSSDTQKEFYRSLLNFVNGNILDDMLWFSQNDKQNVITNPMMSALNALYSVGTRDKSTIVNAFNGLNKASNYDMVAMILSKIANHYNEDIKSFSLNLFDFFKNDLKKLDLVYTGPSLARQIYVYMAFLVGANSYVDEILTNKLLNSQGDVSGILQALALNSIYLNDFERAFVYYNSLIDDYKLTTSENYFLAAVSAIGSNHYDNAVALIQLSRMNSNTNLEARYALGLLHQTIGNLNLASLQFHQIHKEGFKSDFFDFEIDTSKILEE
ncbi:tetratricopeptide repeat protein [Helicobacter sp. MIT 14-3879]|uniref:tetratricopeptide repeat protein n=1 Tax=Helicobacter sp. MIT 14-3879 TaxID=2040649 RepID=UPI000E1EB0B2|nr:tetratricopeptide repeat protein [Helicobacter sp. MIT 14-3879]RDU62873.1 hypothetical protein CQA44_06140 [Helicobacter sp. MIT 14-3879]